MATNTVPVTVAATRRVRRDAAGDLDRWARDMCAAAGEFRGFLRAETYRCRRARTVELTVSMTFDGAASAYAWERSSARAALVTRGDELTDGDAVSTLLLPARPATPRWRTALVVWAGLFPFALALNAWADALDQLPVLLRTVATTALLVPLAVYLGIPAVQRGLAALSRRRS